MKWPALIALPAVVLFIAYCTVAPVQDTDETYSERTEQKPQLIVYSISVPTRKMYMDLEIQGFLLPSSMARRDVRPEVQDRYLVRLMEGQVEQLQVQGVDVELPTRRSFTDEYWEEATSDPNCTITFLEKIRAESHPDEPIELGFNIVSGRRFKAAGDIFCPYDENETADRCKESIEREIKKIESTYGPNNVQKVIIGETAEHERPIYAVRIGRITEENDDASPALYYIATQHAREWMAAEAAMRIIRYFAEELSDNPGGDIASLLKDRTLVVVPVANPDGYQHSHDVTRSWRKSRTKQHCELTPGVDLNRNYEVGFGQGFGSGNCSSLIYRGSEAFSESESQALKNLVINDLELQYGPHGSYEPVVALDVHTWGNMVLFHPGTGTSGHDPEECEVGDNCLTPDFGLLRSIFGSEDPESSIKSKTPNGIDPFLDPEWDERWPIGIGDRIIYPVGGGLKGELMMGEFPDGMTKPISVTLELSWWNPYEYSPFLAEDFPKTYVDDLAANQIELVHYLLELLPDIKNGSYAASQVGHYSIPAIERRCYGQYDNDYQVTGECWNNNQPALYAAALKGLTNVKIFPPDGYLGTSNDDVKGHTYNLYQWVPDKPYIFPPEAIICSRQEGCKTIVLDDGHNQVNLCTTGLFPEGKGFTFRNFPFCGWVIDGGVGSYIARKRVSLKTMRDARLFYSFLQSSDGCKIVQVRIQSRTKQRIVRRHPRTGRGVFNNSSFSFFNTEVVDAMDFDGEEDVTVIFEVTSDEGNCDPFIVSDVVFVGWKVND